MKTWRKISRQSSQDELAPDDDFLLYESPKKKLSSWLTQLLKALEFPQLISMELPNTVSLQMQKVNWKRF